MKEIKARVRRTLLPALGAAVLLAGCAHPRLLAPELDGTYCYRYKGGTPPFNSARYRTCTTSPVPPAAADAEAKRFEPVPGLATVYVVRRGWADGSHRIPVTVDGGPETETVPRSLVRIQLQPGAHALAFKWQNGKCWQPCY